MVLFNHDVWAKPDAKADSELNASSEQEADPYGVSISVRSSSDWEEVTTPVTTFWDVAREAGVVGMEPAWTYLDLVHCEK